MRLAFATVLALAAASAGASGCIKPLECSRSDAVPGAALGCPVTPWLDRSFDLDLPSQWDGRAPLPLVVAFHGGGGNKRAAASVTCPDGSLDDAGCLSAVARRAGFAVVRPDGTGNRPIRNVRTWNAGGGHDGFTCASGVACREGVDDVQYFDDLMRAIEALIPVDAARVHLTGLSNGGAISHRLACERGARIASIAAVGGANQHGETGGRCDGGVAVLHIHGTEDPCWGYEQGSTTCTAVHDDSDVKIGVATTLEGWRRRNGCEATRDEVAVPDADPNDGTRSTRVAYRGCHAAVEGIRIEGGGHTWPDGDQYFPKSVVGRVTRDFGSEILVEFFRAHPKP